MPGSPVPPFAFAGEIASLSAALIWAVTMCAFKSHGTGYHPQTLNLFKSFIAFFFMSLLLFFVGPAWPDVQTAGVLALSGLIGIVIGDSILFSSLTRIGASLASATQCLSPAFTCLLALFFLGEKLDWMELLGLTVVVCAVLGAVLFARPYLKFAGPVREPKQFALGVFYGVASALMNSIGIVMIRKEVQDVDVLSATFLRTVSAFVVLLAILSVRARRVELGRLLKSPLPLGAASFFGTFVGLLLMSMGAKYAKAGVTAALTSSYPIWIIPVAAYTLGERIGWRSILCILGAALGVILLFQ